MNLLFVTQVVDSEDSVLGAYHGWIAEFSKYFESFTVICLKEGKHRLPENVRVYSLGKEKGRRSRLSYVLHFLALAWRLRRDYDAVFVHMNQEYVLIAGPLWNMLGKPVYLWRNHFAGSWLTDCAAVFCRNVFCTSRASYTAKYKKTILMPVGIDTGIFKLRTDVTRAPHAILSLGRIAPSKNLHVLIEAFGLLSARSVDFSADIYGDALSKDASYAEKLSARVKGLGLERVVHFHAGIPNRETPRIYGAHEIFVNCSPAGMFDKTLLEAAACGCRVLSTSQDFREEAGESAYTASDASNIASGLGRLMKASQSDDLSDIVSRHSLEKLGERLSCILTESPASPIA